jgi:GDP-fucose protein O-fucosyltransferase
MLKGMNPNQHGMVESIVCTRAAAFAGTYFSTFTGYIHRLRGYHGLGESTYYHTTGHIFTLQVSDWFFSFRNDAAYSVLSPLPCTQSAKSVGNGFSREWRAGWTDDAGELI